MHNEKAMFSVRNTLVDAFELVSNYHPILLVITQGLVCKESFPHKQIT